jgi:hypothetical protein
MGATVTAPTHTIHPVANPARFPKEKWGYRAEPPATGYMPPSSAWTSARTSITRAPSTQEIIAAGPAICDAYRAPNSQPDPITDPSQTKSNPIVLTSLCSLWATSPRASSVRIATVTPPFLFPQTPRTFPYSPCGILLVFQFEVKGGPNAAG